MRRYSTSLPTRLTDSSGCPRPACDADAFPDAIGRQFSRWKSFSIYLPYPGSIRRRSIIRNSCPSEAHPATGFRTASLTLSTYNLTLQRALGSKTVMTLAYVGTEGHRLLTQVEANPGNAALCLSLRGSGVKAGTVQCGPNGENTTYTLPNGSQVFGTRGPFGNSLTSDSYQMNTAIPATTPSRRRCNARAGDFNFLAAYTFSKSIDDASGYQNVSGGNTRAQTNFTNYRLSRSVSAFNIPNNFVVQLFVRDPAGQAAARVAKTADARLEHYGHYTIR